jgi:hypothetical protein
MPQARRPMVLLAAPPMLGRRFVRIGTNEAMGAIRQI